MRRLTATFVTDRLVTEETLLDASGLRCPLPVLKAKKALKAAAPGQVLKVLATDPDSPQDFENFCRTTGDELLSSTQDGDVFVYRIRKSP